MLIRNLQIKPGEKVRKAVYIKGKKYYAEIVCEKVYPYQVAHSRDLRKKHTGGD